MSLCFIHFIWDVKLKRGEEAMKLKVVRKKRTILNFWFQLKERRQYYGVILEIFLKLMSVILYANCHKFTR